MRTYTEEEVQDYIDGLAIDYGTDALNRHAAITHLLEDNIDRAVAALTYHEFLPEVQAVGGVRE